VRERRRMTSKGSKHKTKLNIAVMYFIAFLPLCSWKEQKYQQTNKQTNKQTKARVEESVLDWGLVAHFVSFLFTPGNKDDFVSEDTYGRWCLTEKGSVVCMMWPPYIGCVCSRSCHGNCWSLLWLLSISSKSSFIVSCVPVSHWQSVSQSDVSNLARTLQ
jgi:hypothetical protein